ncbi:sigma factor [Pseudomonas tritici]|uniref:sigma factor n=1 Tax=Pseudomonas tritici TaxID=2745518 RepID=UPI00387B4F15
MNAQANIASAVPTVGFVIPDRLADFPTAPRPGLRLSLEQEQAFGFSVLKMTIAQIQALACDRVVIAGLLDEMESAFTKNNKATKAVALVFVDGVWIRYGTITDEEFSALARTRIAVARQCLEAIVELDSKERDLFFVQALDALRTALAQVVPYDAVLSKATNLFKERCGDLTAACRDLVQYVATEMHLSRPTARGVCELFWLSNKLPAICFGSNRYVQSIMPVKAKRDFRFGILGRQQRIARVALASGVPVIELLGSWSSFFTLHQRLDRLTGAFAMLNTGLAEKTAREYNFATDNEQVRSAANVGLCRAISLYAPEKGMKFSTYAITWIKQSIIRDLVQQDQVRLPEGSHAKLVRVRAVYADLPHASDEYVCKAANVAPFDFEALRPYVMGTDALSLDTLPNSTGVDGDLHSMIADENNDFVSEIEDESEMAFRVAKIKDALTEREFYVLTRRSGLCGADIVPVNDLAQMLETSPQNISRIVKNVQVKLANVEGLSDN